MNSYFHELFTSLKNTFGWPLAVLAIALGFIFWIFSPEDEISIIYAVFFPCISIIPLATFFDLSVRLHSKAKSKIPKVLAYIENYDKNILLLDESEIMSHGAIVSIYSKHKNFEILIAFGRIHIIQENGKAQVVVDKIVKGQEDRFKSVMQNDVDNLKSILVKPTVSLEYFDTLR